MIHTTGIKLIQLVGVAQLTEACHPVQWLIDECAEVPSACMGSMVGVWSLVANECLNFDVLEEYSELF